MGTCLRRLISVGSELSGDDSGWGWNRKQNTQAACISIGSRRSVNSIEVVKLTGDILNYINVEEGGIAKGWRAPWVQYWFLYRHRKCSLIGKCCQYFEKRQFKRTFLSKFFYGKYPWFFCYIFNLLSLTNRYHFASPKVLFEKWKE